ncbi:unnamed protein product [Parnassius mnemosyne]|uniref:Guanylate kinase-like domain-containing protein n=1 Tax=Parnassius mnemosyne TaxID=213953 RepID=A0AAV1KVA5_9NEOP
MADDYENDVRSLNSNQRTKIGIDPNKEKNNIMFQFSKLTKTLSGGEIKRTSSDICRINYLRARESGISAEGIKLFNNVYPGKEISSQASVSSQTNTEGDILEEQFPINVTNLMNEDQLWGCFYTFPELYSDVYSPVVRIRKPEDVPEIAAGVLTRDLVAACLSYIKRTPILGDFVFIKLDLSSKQIINIDVLQHYKYLVYLDLSSNLLTELFVLSQLPYLQFLSVAYNRLNTVLDYETPQWFLTEVHYKYNSVTKVRDLADFWSITVLDLSHNNIKYISGFENLRYLRRLDLSFNHIKRLENLNHLRLLWLDVSYNNIANFEFNENAGLWSLLDLEYLNLNENNLTCMKIFSGCTRLRELHVRNNRLGVLLEIAVYMRQLRRLTTLDMRSNPVCSTPGYKDVVIRTFPLLLYIDAECLDPIEQRTSNMEMNMDINTFASRRLLRLLYIEQLSKTSVSPFTPPADTTEVPLVVLVGYEAVGKGTLARRLATEYSSNIQLAIQHTTASHHFVDHYIRVSRKKFDDMILNGEFLTYSERDGESYGLSREEAFIKDGRVRLATMDLIGALMLKLRGRQPYLILASHSNKATLSRRQKARKEARILANEKKISMMLPQEISTLQMLLSGRIIVTGILNEILLAVPAPTEHTSSLNTSEYPFMTETEADHKSVKAANKLGTMNMSSSSFRSYGKKSTHRSSEVGGTSIYSLYKAPKGTADYISETNAKKSEFLQTLNKIDKRSTNKSVDFTKYTSSTWEGMPAVHGSVKSSKSVAFTSQDVGLDEHSDASGLFVESPLDKDEVHMKTGQSISTKLYPHLNFTMDAHDSDIWLAFLIDAGVLHASEIVIEPSDSTIHHDTKGDELEFIVKQIEHHEVPSESTTTTIRDDYEDIHRKIPGLFWDTITMDNPEVAFKKMKKIIHKIIKTQQNLKPMFDIDFANLDHYTTVQNRLNNICRQIAPQKLFL